MYGEYDEDPELAYAMKLSMMEQKAAELKVPEEPEESVDQTLVLNI